jgi:hypothetical protein
MCPFALTSAAIQAYSGTKAVCSGNGRCLSLREVNEYGDAVSFGAGVRYDNWDADMIHGCVCDDGWEGPACERRSCPKGDDPLTAPQDDVQLLDCKCSTCNGGVYLSFLGQQTALIPFDASEQLIAYRLGVRSLVCKQQTHLVHADISLQQLSTIRAVDVQFLQGVTMCSALGSIAEVMFHL